MRVRIPLAVLVLVGVNVNVGVLVGVRVSEGARVSVGVGVAVGVSVGVLVGVSVGVGVNVVVGMVGVSVFKTAARGCLAGAALTRFPQTNPNRLPISSSVAKICRIKFLSRDMTGAIASRQ